MPEYFSVAEVKRRRAEIKKAFDTLLRRPSVVQRPESRQWLFFGQCLDALLGAKPAPVATSRLQAAQYKFEIEERLKRFYLSEGRFTPFVFRLMDQKRALGLDFIPEQYPSLAGYVLLICPSRPELVSMPRSRELRDYLIATVTNAANAEMAAYKRLPEIDLAILKPYFVVSGAAYMRIRNVLEQHKKQGRTISHPEYNPSTMRVHKVKVLEIFPRQAFVRTQEYWYLRWWSLPDRRYVTIFDEITYNRYFVKKIGGRWLVESNEYPQPRNRSRMRKPKANTGFGEQI